MIIWTTCPGKCDHGRSIIKHYPADEDIPVCPRCGGLGEMPEDHFLKIQARRVREARFAFCPFDSRAHFIFPPPPSLRLRALHEMQSGLYAMRRYLNDQLPPGSYAAALLDGPLSERLATTEQEIDEQLDIWRTSQEISRPANEELWFPTERAIEGRLDAAAAMLQEVLRHDDDPSAETLLYVARFHAQYRRDWLTALSFIKQARERYPDSAAVHIEMFFAQDALHLLADLHMSFMDAMECPDADDFPMLVAAKAQLAEQREAIPDLKEAIRQIIDDHRAKGQAN